MKASKIKLKSSDRSGYGYDRSLPSITHALPFYKSNNRQSRYFHRIRSACNHSLFGKFSHTSVLFWCGGSGFISNGKGRLYSEIPEGEVLCATCDGKAIGAGEDGARIINGRDVMYSPRSK